MQVQNITISTPFIGILQILFITLKLTKVIAWSWWWILSPLWGPPVLFIGGFFVFLFILMFGGIILRVLAELILVLLMFIERIPSIYFKAEHWFIERFIK